MNWKLLLFLLCFATEWVIATQPTQLRSHHFTEADGLSSNLVYGFAQDHNGLMWIGTSNGLNRFDGSTFKVFRKDFADINSVRDNMIIRIAVDSKNNIWIGYAAGGISSYNQVTRQFTHYLPDSTVSNTISYGGIDGMCIDSKDRIWLGIATKGLTCYNPKTGKFKDYGLLPYGNKKRSATGQQYYNRITQLQIDSVGILWMATGDGFYSLNTETDEWNVYRFDDKEEDITKWKRDVFNTIYRTGPDDFYLGGWGRGLNHYNMKTKKWNTYLISPDKPESGMNNIISSIMHKSEKELWITSGDTVLSVFNIETKKFIPLSLNVLMKNDLSESGLGVMYPDRNKDIWVAHVNGFHIIEQGEQQFNFTRLQVTHSDNKEYYGVVSTLTDPVTGKLFLSTSYADGLNVIDSSGTQNNYLFEVDKTDPIYIMGDLFLDSRKNIWVSTPEHLYHFNRENNKLIKITQPVPDSSCRPTPFFVHFAEASDGKLWISTFRHGIYIYEYTTNTYRQLFHQKENKNSLLSNVVTGMAIDADGNVWIGYKADGVSRYNPVTGKYTHYLHNPKNPRSLIDNRIFKIVCDQTGGVWIGTAMGLVRIDKTCKDGEVNNFIKDQQLLGVLVSEMEFDDSGKLWFVNTKGLSVLDPANNKLKNYNVSNGLYTLFESLSIHTQHKNNFYLGTYGGYYKFNPNIADKEEKPEKVLITNFMVGGKEIPYELELESRSRIVLPATDNFFSLEFNTVNFINPVGVVYYYRLGDEEWKQIPLRGYASYSHLPGGDYIFEVKVMNASGVFSDVTRVPIHIETPFYKTPLFTILLTLVISGSIFTLYRIRVRSIEKTEAIKTSFNKQLAETEMRALRAQMNPHFIFNCLNSINRYIIKNDQKTASLYLTKFARLIRLILDNSEQHVVALSQEMEALKLYIDIEALRFDHRFSYEIDVEKDVNTDSVYVPSMIIQPFVENAIWHGLLHKETPGKLIIRLKREPEMLIVEVEDDGVGREKAKEMKSKSATTRKSLGLKITSDRLKMLHSNTIAEGVIEYIDLYNKNGASGTLVRIKIPVDSDN
ncbi:MAG: histidine kinase [Bacteroidetes bacterium]|nr:histidine kinase [Bacteroidota bacterium]